MEYSYIRELKKIGKYNAITVEEDLKLLYKEHLQIVENIHNLWYYQKCFILVRLFEGVSGLLWNHLMIVDFLEHLGYIKKIHTSSFSNHNVYIMLKKIDIDQYDYVKLMLKEIDNLI